MFPTQRGVVAVTVAGRMTGLGSLMVKVEIVMLVVLLDWDVGAWGMCSRGMTWESTAVGLKPPSREHVVATDRLTAGKGMTRRQAGSLPPLVGVDDDAVVDLLDQADHEVVHVAVVGVAGLVMSSFMR